MTALDSSRKGAYGLAPSVIYQASQGLGAGLPSQELLDDLDKPMTWASLVLLQHYPTWTGEIVIHYTTVRDGTELLSLLNVHPFTNNRYGTWSGRVDILFRRLTAEARVMQGSTTWFKVYPQRALRLAPRQQLAARRDLSQWLARKWPEGTELLGLPPLQPIDD